MKEPHKSRMLEGTSNDGGSSIPGLDGLFNPKTVDESETVNNSHLNMEREYLDGIVAGTDYKSEDVVSVAFGTSNAVRGNELDHIYLTSRGLSESEDDALRPEYVELGKMVHLGLDSLKDCLTSGTMEDIMKSGNLERNDSDLEGKDGKRRIIIYYMNDITNQTFR